MFYTSQYTKDTKIIGSDPPTDNELQEIPQVIDADEEIEFFECVHCGQYNIIKTKVRKRRETKIRHLRVNDVTWASLKKYKTINGVSMDYALMSLLAAARTKNISYLISERRFTDPSFDPRTGKKKSALGDQQIKKDTTTQYQK